ncbi:MotA/TolQ/ExbB proton channel family protein [Methylothermus subterraneus]
MRWLWWLLWLPIAATGADFHQLLEKIRREGVAERAHQEERLKRFLAEHARRQQLVDELKAELARTKARADALRARLEAGEKRLAELDDQWKNQAGDLEELFSQARQDAQAIKSLLHDSLVNAQQPGRLKFLDELASPKLKASLEDLKRLWDVLLSEIGESGRVVRFSAPVVAPDGSEQNRTVVRVGVFNAFSQGRYLRYLPGSERLLDPVQQPPGRPRRLAADLEQAQGGWHKVALDPSRGALLALVAQTPGWLERWLHQGGVVGYFIIALGALGLAIVCWRYGDLILVERRLRRQKPLPEPRLDNPIGRLRQALAERKSAQGGSDETLAVYLDELVQHELQRLYLGMNTLSTFATIAPLLGLLGTVLGMIETFDAIALFGTGDPKLMSSGISLALVTTEQGLTVAIPLLIAHSFLRGRAERIAALITEEGAELFERYSHG